MENKIDRRTLTFSYLPEPAEVEKIEEARGKIEKLLDSPCDYRQACVLIFRRGLQSFMKGDKKA